LSTSKGQIKNIKNTLGHRVRIDGTASIINAPINELIGKLIERQLALYKTNSKNKRMVVGVPIPKLQHLPVYDIVLIYRSVLNGIFNYYSFVDNRSRLNVIHWILKSGLAKVIATKMKLKSMRKVFEKYGRDITIVNPKTRNTINFSCPELVRKPMKFFLSKAPELDTNAIAFGEKYRINSLGSDCVSCGKKKKYHLKHTSN
jgi:hypothetical protein